MLAAYCRANTAWTQREIGERLNLGTQVRVSRLLAIAKAEGYLVERFAFPTDLSDDERRGIERGYYARHTELEHALAAHARELNDQLTNGGSPFARLFVVGTPDLDGDDEQSMENAFRLFGVRAADVVSESIDQADTVCVAWGRTIEATLRALHPRTQRYDKVFMPIAGEPINHEPNGISPSDAARALAAAWPGSEHLPLRGVLARIPRSVYERDEQGIARELVGCSQNYEEIFGRTPEDRNRRMARVAMILTGLGDMQTSQGNADAGRPTDPWYKETVQAEDQSVLELTVGNIGGIWIPRRDLTEEQHRAVRDLNARWLGAQAADLRRCSMTADLSRGRPGVVVVAVEPEKADIVLEALYLTNILIVSYPLAERLAEKLGVAARRSA